MVKLRTRPVARYFVEFTDISPYYCSRMTRAWQVFDREKVSMLSAEDADANEGRWPIALCLSRSDAVKIRNALNATEDPINKEPTNAD